MRTLTRSLRDLNDLHPLLGGVVAGLLAVALLALFLPGDLPSAVAWQTFVTIGLGVGLGQFARLRGRAQPGTGTKR